MSAVLWAIFFGVAVLLDVWLYVDDRRKGKKVWPIIWLLLAVWMSYNLWTVVFR